MAYNLFAVVGPADLLPRIEHPQLHPTVALAEGFALRPLDTEWLADEADVHPGDIDAVCALLAHEVYAAIDDDGSRVAYLAVETFGGGVDDGAIVWDRGQVVYLNHVEDASLDARPSHDALAMIGAVAAPGLDVFDTLGLGRHRTTEEWR